MHDSLHADAVRKSNDFLEREQGPRASKLPHLSGLDQSTAQPGTYLIAALVGMLLWLSAHEEIMIKPQVKYHCRVSAAADLVDVQSIENTNDGGTTVPVSRVQHV